MSGHLDGRLVNPGDIALSAKIDGLKIPFFYLESLKWKKRPALARRRNATWSYSARVTNCTIT